MCCFSANENALFHLCLNLLPIYFLTFNFSTTCLFIPHKGEPKRVSSKQFHFYMYMSVADLRGGVRDARPPLCVQILSISCSFWENLAKLRVHAPPLEGSRPPLGEILDPSLYVHNKLRCYRCQTSKEILVSHPLSPGAKKV